MKSQLNYMNEESMLGPGTDLVISLVAVLVVLMSLSMAAMQSQQKELEKLADLDELKERNALLLKVKEYQKEIIQEISEKYNSVAQTKDSVRYKIVINENTPKEDTISIYNDVTLQRISFGEKILFRTGASRLQKSGKESISAIAEIIKPKLDRLKEIQIQGHADISGNERENLNLASRRSVAVFEHLRTDSKIDPTKHLMSASSYGAYMPVQRNIDDPSFNKQKLMDANATETLKNRNRRIEIVLNYRGNFINKKVK